MSGCRYYLGIDGGGSKTEAVVIDSEQRVLGVGTAGGSNTTFTSRQNAEANFTAAISEAIVQAGISAEMICAGNCTFAAAAPSSFAALGLKIKPERLGEHSVAFERAGIEEHLGVALIAGTGSSCTGFNRKGDRTHAGGWGAVLGDDGGGYDIGRRGIREVLWAEEGRVPPTLLREELLDYFRISHPSEIIRVFTGGLVNQALTAGFAARVSAAAGRGDDTARRLLGAAGDDLAQLALFVAKGLFTGADCFPLVLAGGVFNAGEVLVGRITTAFEDEYPECRVVMATMRPGEAAARIARRNHDRRA